MLNIENSDFCREFGLTPSQADIDAAKTDKQLIIEIDGARYQLTQDPWPNQNYEYEAQAKILDEEFEYEDDGFVTIYWEFLDHDCEGDYCSFCGDGSRHCDWDNPCRIEFDHGYWINLLEKRNKE